MLIHGTDDQIVPWDHSKHLHSILKKPHEPYWVEGAGHNDVVERRDYLWSRYDDRCEAEGLDEMEPKEASVLHRKYQSQVFHEIQESERRYYEVIARFVMDIAVLNRFTGEGGEERKPRFSGVSMVSGSPEREATPGGRVSRPSSRHEIGSMLPPGCVAEGGPTPSEASTGTPCGVGARGGAFPSAAGTEDLDETTCQSDDAPSERGEPGEELLAQELAMGTHIEQKASPVGKKELPPLGAGMGDLEPGSPDRIAAIGPLELPSVTPGRRLEPLGARHGKGLPRGGSLGSPLGRGPANLP